MKKGYIKLYRKFWDNPISGKPTYLAVFIYIVTHANHKDQEIIVNNQPKLIKRGQYFGSMKKIADQFKMQRSTVKYIFDYFLKAGVISVQEKNTNFTFITINNYSQYQDVVQEEYRDNTGIQLNKNEKNVKREEKKSVYARQDFNNVTSWEELEEVPTTDPFIHARKMEGKQVFDWLWEGWQKTRRGDIWEARETFRKCIDWSVDGELDAFRKAVASYSGSDDVQEKIIMNLSKFMKQWRNWDAENDA